MLLLLLFSDLILHFRCWFERNANGVDETNRWFWFWGGANVPSATIEIRWTSIDRSREIGKTKVSIQMKQRNAAETLAGNDGTRPLWSKGQFFFFIWALPNRHCFRCFRSMKWVAGAFASISRLLPSSWCRPRQHRECPFRNGNPISRYARR